jgi:hypothetical protein
LIAFGTDNNTGGVGRFDNSDVISWLIEGSDIYAEDFNAFSQQQGGEGTWLSAAKVQNISSAPGSTWIGAVPEPSTFIISGLFLLGAGVFVRRKLHRKS